jgi:hypothetical protein
MPLPNDVHQLADMTVPDRFPRLVVAGIGCSSLLMSIYTILFQAPSSVLFEQHSHLFYQILLLLAVLALIMYFLYCNYLGGLIFLLLEMCFIYGMCVVQCYCCMYCAFDLAR